MTHLASVAPQRAEAARSPRLSAAFCLAAGVALSLTLAWFCYRPSEDGVIRRAGEAAAYAGGDYLNMFVGAHLIAQGRADDVFNFDAYMRAAHALTSPLLPFHLWSYPPTLLMFVWPLALVSYGVGFALWTFGGLVALMAACATALRRPQRRLFAFALLLAPASILNLADGQNGFFTAALFLGALRVLDEKPVLAGVLFGLLTLKPQLALLAPFILIALRRWSSIVAAGLTALALIAASAAAFGLEPWLAYVHATSSYEVAFLNQAHGFSAFMMESVYVAARLIGLSVAAATVAQALAFALAAWASVFIVRRAADFETRALALSCAALLATPYAFNYDMTAASAASLLYLARRGAPSPLMRASLAALWLTPALVMFLNSICPVGPLFVALPLAMLVAWAARAPSPAPGAKAYAV